MKASKQHNSMEMFSQTHECAPTDWRGIPDMTGSYEMDGMIHRTKNQDMRDRLADHLVTDNTAYRKRTGYNNSTLD